MGSYLRPERLEQVLEALRAGPLTIVAGGTDIYPARVGRPLDDDVLDITAIAGLRGIEDRGDCWRIGALATWSDVIGAELPPCFDGLKRAAREVGGRQIQNVGTVAGNVCNASPAADGAPNLVALDAAVELASAGGERAVPIGEFITGNRTTTRRVDEIVVGLTVPKPAPGTASTFLKLGARRHLVISIAMVAIVLKPDGDTVGAVRIAVGACAPTARRLPALEAAFAGSLLDRHLGDAVDEAQVSEALAPIDDVRGSAAYRLDAVRTLIRRGLGDLGTRLGERP